MIDDRRASQWRMILSQLAEVGGRREYTRLYPNAEIIDATPAALPAGFMTVRGRHGYYETAVKLASLTYTDGDYVNLLYLEGTEPIAFGYGSSSSSTFAGGWPFDTNTHTVDPSDTDADYISVDDALDAATGIAAGETAMVGVATYGAADFGTANTDLVGTCKEGVEISTSTVAVALELAGNNYVADLTVINTHTAVDTYGIRSNSVGNPFELFNIDVSATNTNSNVYGIWTDGDNGKLVNVCVDVVSGGFTVGNALRVTGTCTVEIWGGYFDGDDDSIYVDTNATVTLYGPTLSKAPSGPGTIQGCYYDPDGDFHCYGTTDGWPFANVITVSSTDPQANYTTITLAIAGAGAGDIIFLDAETFTESPNVNKDVFIVGIGRNKSVIDGDVTFSITGAGLQSVTVSGSVILSGATMDIYMFNCHVDQDGTVADTNAVVITGNNCTLWAIDCGVTCDTTTGDARCYFSNNVAGEINIRGGSTYPTATAGGDEYAVLSSGASITARLSNMPQLNGSISNVNTIGHYQAGSNNELIGYNTSNNLSVFGPGFFHPKTIVAGDVIEVPSDYGGVWNGDIVVEGELLVNGSLDIL